jgi:hypothetical protein
MTTADQPRPEGRYRLRVLKNTSAAAPDFPRGARVHAGEEGLLIWRPSTYPVGPLPRRPRTNSASGRF